MCALHEKLPGEEWSHSCSGRPHWPRQARIERFFQGRKIQESKGTKSLKKLLSCLGSVVKRLSWIFLFHKLGLRCLEGERFPSAFSSRFLPASLCFAVTLHHRHNRHPCTFMVRRNSQTLGKRKERTRISCKQPV